MSGQNSAFSHQGAATSTSFKLAQGSRGVRAFLSRLHARLIPIFLEIRPRACRLIHREQTGSRSSGRSLARMRTIATSPCAFALCGGGHDRLHYPPVLGSKAGHGRAALAGTRQSDLAGFREARQGDRRSTLPGDHGAAWMGRSAAEKSPPERKCARWRKELSTGRGIASLQVLGGSSACEALYNTARVFASIATDLAALVGRNSVALTLR